MQKKPLIVGYKIKIPKTEQTIKSFIKNLSDSIHNIKIKPKYFIEFPYGLEKDPKFNIETCSFLDYSFVKGFRSIGNVDAEDIFLTYKNGDLLELFEIILDSNIQLKKIAEFRNTNTNKIIPHYENNRYVFYIIKDDNDEVKIYRGVSDRCDEIFHKFNSRFVLSIPSSKPFIIIKDLTDRKYRGFWLNSPQKIFDVPKLGNFYGIDMSENINIANSYVEYYEKRNLITILALSKDGDISSKEEICLDDNPVSIERIIFNRDENLIFYWTIDENHNHKMMVRELVNGSLKAPQFIIEKPSDTRRTNFFVKIDDVIIDENVVMLLRRKEESYDSEEYSLLGVSEEIFILILNKSIKPIASFGINQNISDYEIRRYKLYKSDIKDTVFLLAMFEPTEWYK